MSKFQDIFKIRIVIVCGITNEIEEATSAINNWFFSDFFFPLFFPKARDFSVVVLCRKTISTY